MTSSTLGVTPEAVHEAMQNAPHDGQPYRQALVGGDRVTVTYDDGHLINGCSFSLVLADTYLGGPPTPQETAGPACQYHLRGERCRCAVYDHDFEAGIGPRKPTVEGPPPTVIKNPTPTTWQAAVPGKAPEQTFACRLGAACHHRNPPKPVPFYPSVDDFDLLPDA